MSSTIAEPTDWSLCVLCQEHSKTESLREDSKKERDKRQARSIQDHCSEPQGIA